MKLSVSLLTLTLLFLMCGCSSRDSNIVYDAFYSASLYPEKFDEYVESELSEKTDEFLDCAYDVKLKLSEQFVDVTEHCESLPPEFQDACRDVDEVKLSMVIDGMIAVVRDGASYPNTLPGQAAILGKSFIGEQMWIDLQKQITPLFKSVLICD